MGRGAGNSGEMPVSREVKVAGGVGAAGLMLYLGYDVCQAYMKPKAFYSLIGNDASKFPILRVIVHSANKRLFVQSGLVFPEVVGYIRMEEVVFYSIRANALSSVCDAFKLKGNTDIEIKEFELRDYKEKTQTEFWEFLNESSAEYRSEADKKRREHDIAIFSQFVGELLRLVHPQQSGDMKPTAFFAIVNDSLGFPSIRVIVHATNRRLFTQTGITFSGARHVFDFPGVKCIVYLPDDLDNVCIANKTEGVNGDIQVEEFRVSASEKTALLYRRFASYVSESRQDYPDEKDEKIRERDKAIFSLFVDEVLKISQAS